MDYPKFIVLNQKEQSISIHKVNEKVTHFFFKLFLSFFFI